ncbi:hypothetical protein CI15_21670 [Paraburkholderia monticola]|uniref:Uncharacterized protein n=1 Tax=Paraburkholderia monticola TaxID=1399968 RepID=A0A149PIL2_9BURK|nr:hypothetical protein CI15_21670 [Paraburkholderia monticola]
MTNFNGVRSFLDGHHTVDPVVLVRWSDQLPVENEFAIGRSANEAKGWTGTARNDLAMRHSAAREGNDKRCQANGSHHF